MHPIDELGPILAVPLILVGLLSMTWTLVVQPWLRRRRGCREAYQVLTELYGKPHRGRTLR